MTVRVAVAGSTGIIGELTLDILRQCPDEYDVVALAAKGSSPQQLVTQAKEFRPAALAVAEVRTARTLQSLIPWCDVRTGPGGLASLADDADVVVNGVVGFAGLPVTLESLRRGRRLVLANKESLIAAGPLVQQVRSTPGAVLLPADSEHCALHMCLGSRCTESGVRRLILTASGGPFRLLPAADRHRITVRDALAHPTWTMGPKLAVDSSTLMNKGLEIIEANELFGRPAGSAGCGVHLEQIEVLIHPQSIVHSMVEFDDGSTLAQLSEPDMRLPLGYGLAYPKQLRLPHGVIDWTMVSALEFQAPDVEAFPCLRLASDAAKAGAGAPAWLNAANEVAVEAFLTEKIPWTGIAGVVAAAMDDYPSSPISTLDELVDVDERGRRSAHRHVADARAVA